MRKRGISGSTLKMIAVAAMLIDHIGAVVLWPLLLRQMTASENIGMIPQSTLYEVYYVFRMVIGRAAFPIFCFLLTEGMRKSSDRKRYILRLGLFALVSEIPFDLAINGEVMNVTYQNVFFTLMVGLGTMLCVEKLQKSILRHWGSETVSLPLQPESPAQNSVLVKLFSVLGCIVCVAAGVLAAELLRTDYGGYGVLCIMVLYFFGYSRRAQLIAGTVAFPVAEILYYGTTSELLAVLGFVPIALYNGERGRKMKYFFYVFYPVHLLVLYVVQRLLV